MSRCAGGWRGYQESDECPRNAAAGRRVLLYVALVFFMTLPGLVVGLTVLGILDRLGWWATGRRGLPWFRDGRRPAPAAALDELQAMFHAAKRHSIEQRKLELVLRDDEHDGAPPRIRIDLDARRAIITPPAPPRPSGP